ncbi:MAG: DUF3098 domain-containing protein [Flavobacteriales bacterium]|jgi:hypothetical protein|nr:DUF3098 domain-containing protein [Flavobacteriales bacterium]MCB9363725.1 DUF3098 domain-containing protein [Flavobacteriales bacterium]
MNNETNKDFAFGKENYILVAAGTILAILGYILMSGGGSDDPTVFSEDLFSFRRMYISPIMIIVGLAIVGWGIMKKVKD